MLKPLIELIYRVCIKLPATVHQITDETRLAVFRTMIGTHPVLFSTLLGFMSDSQDAELNITLIEGAPLSHWSPTSVDTSLGHDWLFK